MAKLDKLLQLEEAPDTKLDIESAGSEFYKEKSGKIRIMDESTEWLDDPIEPEGGWLDDPVEPEGGWLDDPVESKKHSDTGMPSADGIQLMDFRKHHEEEKR